MTSSFPSGFRGGQEPPDGGRGGGGGPPLSLGGSERSPRPRDRERNHQPTDSDGSADTNSSHESNAGEGQAGGGGAISGMRASIESAPAPQAGSGSGVGGGKRAGHHRGTEWIIIEGLKDGQRYDKRPDVFSGYLHKKRKWPLKGWHKRFFVVDKGILVYGKNPNDVNRGKLHGSLDIGLAVISAKHKEKRLDIDAEEFIYHLKAKQHEVFIEWVEQLKKHRLYRQHVLTYGGAKLQSDSATPARVAQPKVPLARKTGSEGSSGRSIAPAGARTTSPAQGVQWLVDTDGALHGADKELVRASQALDQLSRILDRIESSAPESELSTSCPGAQEGYSPNVKKDRKKFGLRKKKSGSRVWSGSSLELSSAAAAVAAVAAVAPASATQPNSNGVAVGFVTGSSPVTCVTNTADYNNDSSSPLSMSSGGVTSPSPSPSRPQSLPPPSCLAAAMNQQQQPQQASMLSLHQTDSLSASAACLLFQSESHLAADFVALAKEVYASLKSVLETETCERERLRCSSGGGGQVPTTPGALSPVSASASASVLRQALRLALRQNAELRSRLAAVHQHSDLGDITDNVKTLQSSLSYSSSCVSGSEFFDAEDTFHYDAADNNSDDENGEPPIDDIEDDDDYEDDDEEKGGPRSGKAPPSDTSSVAGSVSSEEGSLSSEASDFADSEYNPTQNVGGGGPGGAGGGRNLTGRRSKLPVPRPNTEGLSLWNLLTKNIGKDLSQVSMPVALNEPLNMLQRMCEELEYSELLDKASELSDPYERMVYVAAFAVSSYGSSYFRAGSKPFNPLLGETYECIREDKGFRFIAEQVSHHPPVSVCFAESRNFVFWQDIRIKTKFWGKSMEFQPTGHVNVKLERPNQSGGSDRYRWNKVTTCVHNLFSAQRWVDQYGELTITSSPSPAPSASVQQPPASDHPITCKLTFVKASYWSAKRHEITGVIVDEKEGRVVRNLFGKWSEAFYCGVAPSARCIWRPGTMPEDYELYYGFTRFAMELNELDIDMAKYLPITDTRFRPDQRLLEEGKLDEAESTKLQLEQAQRERRKKYEIEGIHHVPKWFRKTVSPSGEEAWEYTHKYWESRKSPGFVNVSFEPLW